MRIHGVVSDEMIHHHLLNKYMHTAVLSPHAVQREMAWVRDTIIRMIKLITEEDTAHPPFSPEQAIADKLGEIDCLIEGLEHQQQDLRKALDILNAIKSKAFNQAAANEMPHS